ncbi:male-enhanced antigen 1-like isoform X2 [Lineus longissimus]
MMSPVPDDSEEKKAPDTEDISMDHLDINPIDFTDSDGSDEEEDGDDPVHAGYMPLSQGPPTLDSDEETVGDAQSNLSSSVGSNNSVIDHAVRSVIDSDFDNSIGAVASSIFQGAESNGNADTGTSSLWNQKVTAEPLPKEQAEEVKKVMAGFLLPPSSHPDWAKNLSDDEWKSKVLPHLSGKSEVKVSDSRREEKR